MHHAEHLDRDGYRVFQGAETERSVLECRVAGGSLCGVRVMSTIEKIKSNAEVHGVKWAAAHAARKGINISIVRLALFGRY